MTAINIFIVAFFFVALCLIAPEFGDKVGPFKPLQKLDADYVVPFFKHFLQFDQSWQMFAKGGYHRINFHVVVLLTFKDGSTRMEEFYRLDKRNAFEKWKDGKMLLVLYRMQEPTPDFKYDPSIARYLARAYSSPGNPVTKVVLRYNWGPISSPDNLVPRSQLPQDFAHYTMFDYDVQPEDLK